jgi:hypothetical protein
MYRSYFSYEEEEANKQGHIDEQRHRTDYDHDKYSDNPVDIAYWEGRKDEERQERIREEERLMQEDAEREQHRRLIEQQDREEQQFAELMELERQAELEKEYEEALRLNKIESPVETPITEQELFHQILNDEREENANEKNIDKL